MTDSAIADTLNRHVADLISRQLDLVDWLTADNTSPGWQRSTLAATLMGENPAASDGDRAWLIGMLAARTPGVDFDGHPADCDWDNLFSHFRAQILARRDPKSPSVHEAETPVLDGVGSQ